MVDGLPVYGLHNRPDTSAGPIILQVTSVKQDTTGVSSDYAKYGPTDSSNSISDQSSASDNVSAIEVHVEYGPSGRPSASAETTILWSTWADHYNDIDVLEYGPPNRPENFTSQVPTSSDASIPSFADQDRDINTHKP